MMHETAVLAGLDRLRDMSERERVIIMGAGGRDFHVFNTCFRDDPTKEVVAFTATQIPYISDRRYPPVLSGPHYPDGIAIHPEDELEALIAKLGVDRVVFAYSDVSYDYVAQEEKRVTATGAKFAPFLPEDSLLVTGKPCVAICAVRTGCGKSAVSRYVVAELRRRGHKPAVLRHPMPYGALEKQVVQRFATLEDLDKHECTIEEREEYEPHIEAGSVVFAGADYGKILAEAEKEADVIVWDGGNNDTPFIKPDLLVTLVDPLRPGHETKYFPARWNLAHADVALIVKTGEAKPEDLAAVRSAIDANNPDARVIEGRSPIDYDADALRGKRVLVIEDGPTATHGGMGYGAGYLAAMRAGAEIVDPRPFAVGEIAKAFQKYAHLRAVVPALGYGEKDLGDLAKTIANADCDTVVIGTPIDLTRVIDIDKPCVRVTYGFAERGDPQLPGILAERLGV
jgi:predicted GTPase